MSLDLKQLAVDRSSSSSATVTARPRNLLTRFVLPAGILAAFVAVIGWSLQDSLLPAKSVTVTPVVLMRAEVQQSGTPLFQAAGWIEPRPTATVVSAQVEGVVESLLVIEGQDVRQGDPLAKLVDVDARLALSESKAALRLREAEEKLAVTSLEAARTSLANPVYLQAAVAEAEASLAKANTELRSLPSSLKAAEARLQLAEHDLEGKKSVGDAIPLRSVQRSQSEFDSATASVNQIQQREKGLQAEAKSWGERVAALKLQLNLKTEENRKVQEAEANCTIASARVEQAKLAVESAEVRLARMNIKSPCNGKVLALHAQPGRRLMGLSPASERDSSAVVSLYDPNHLQIRADVRLEDVPQVQVGQPVQIATAAISQPLDGQVIAVTSLADIQKNTLQVKVAIHDPPAVVKPEMLVQVTFLAPELPKSSDIAENDPLRQLIPRDLVKGSADGATVWVADLQNSRAVEKSIQLGRAGTDQLVEVTQGITATDKLIVSGRDDLKNGTRIRVSGEDRSLGASRSFNAVSAQVPGDSKNQK